MKAGTWMACYACYAVMVLETIRNASDLSLAQVKAQGFDNVTARQVLLGMARLGLSPKCAVENIPEWNRMKQNFVIIAERCQRSANSVPSYSVLYRTARLLNVRTHDKSGNRLSKGQLKRCVDRGFNTNAEIEALDDLASPRCKRSYRHMEKELAERGVQTRVYVQGKQKRLKKKALQKLT